MAWIKVLLEYLYDPELIPFNKKNTANYITLLGSWLARFSLLLFFFLAWYYVAEGVLVGWIRYLALSMAISASICDAVDGYVARKYGCETELGKIFDPHHDKVQYLCKTSSLVIDAFIVYLITHNAYYLLFAVAIKYFIGERDEAITFHRLWAATLADDLKLSARQSGKWRTRICFSGLPLLHLLMIPGNSVTAFIIVACLLIITNNYSFADYVRGYRQLYKNYYRQRS